MPDLPAGKVRLTVYCRRCGYNLKGVDPAGKCPECGTDAWPSIRPIVDSTHERYTLLHHPRRIAVSLIAAPSCLLLSAVLLWTPYLSAAIRQMRVPGAPLLEAPTLMRVVAILLLAAAALAATIGLASPTGADAPLSYRKGLNRVRFALIVWAVLQLVLYLHDSVQPQPAQQWSDLLVVDSPRTLIRLGLDLTALLMMIGFLPVARFLTLRSLPHRHGGASRQGFVAILVALLTVLCGDLLRLAVWGLDAAGLSQRLLDPIAMMALMLILVGSAMLTLAVLNLTMDSIRLARNLVRPPRSIEQVIG